MNATSRVVNVKRQTRCWMTPHILQ